MIIYTYNSIIKIFIITAVCLLAYFALASSATNAQELCDEQRRALAIGAIHLDACEEDADVCSVVGTPVNLPDSVPEPYKAIFEEAAAAYDTNVAVLAITHAIENQGGSLNFRDPPPPYGNGPAWPSSSAGASGPFQFIPGTWAAYGVDGNGDGVADVQDLTDAAYGAANFLTTLGATSTAEFGERLDPYATDEPTIVKAWMSYNWGPANVERKNPNIPTETRNYLEQGEALYQQLSPGSASGSSGGACGGVGIGIDGFVFPLLTTKLAITDDPEAIETYGGGWCYQNENNCHHNYNAADIFVPTGTDVLAAKPGVVTSVNNNGGSGGSRVQIRGTDGLLYYYTHMGAGTVTVTEDQSVEAGTKLGEVGTNANAVGTVRHLHFDSLPATWNEGRPSCSGAACTQHPFINVQPALIASFNNLPE